MHKDQLIYTMTFLIMLFAPALINLTSIPISYADTTVPMEQWDDITYSFTKAKMFIDAKKWDEALENLDKVIAAKPQDDQAYLLRATVLIKKGMLGMAEADWKKFVALNPAAASKIGRSVFDLRDHLGTEQSGQKFQSFRATPAEQREWQRRHSYGNSKDVVNQENLKFWVKRFTLPSMSPFEKNRIANLVLNLFPTDKPLARSIELNPSYGQIVQSIEITVNNPSLSLKQKMQTIREYRKKLDQAGWKPSTESVFSGQK